MEDIIDQIKNLHKLHCVTKDFNHIIEYQPGSWKRFEPTKFVYSYFAFNTLYNYDWEASIKERTLISFPIDGEEKLNEMNKIKKMIDFFFKYFEQSDSTDFVRTICRSENQRHKEPLLEAIEGITRDDNISESERIDFKKEFRKLLESEKLIQGKLKNDILRFIYNVRNNIFHGTKTTIEMTNEGQRIRLNIYANILIATNDLLFKALERSLIFRLDKKYKFSI